MDELLAMNVIGIETLRERHADDADIIGVLDLFGESLVRLHKTHRAVKDLEVRLNGNQIHPAAVRILVQGATKAYESNLAEAGSYRMMVESLVARATGRDRYEA